jgi:hypothetical protein
MPPPGQVTLSCLVCRYCLAGLDRESACPECGAPVAAAHGESLLARSSPVYVASLRRAVELLVVAGALSVVTDIAWSAIEAARQLVDRRHPAGLSIVRQVVSIAIVVITTIGWWRLAAPDPAYRGKDRLARLQTTLRLSAAAALAVSGAGAVIVITFRILLSTRGFGDPASHAGTLVTLAQLAFAATLLAVAVRFFASLVLIRALAERSGTSAVAARLARSARRLFWLGPLLVLAYQAAAYGIAVLYFDHSFDPDRGGSMLTALTVGRFLIEQIGVAVYIALWLVLLVRLRTILAAAIGTRTPGLIAPK